ncbi:RNA polymerase sigma-70 factor (ECF subfamily) [Bradyrhizobium japonicum]|uniref:RNA polymerase sigma-70 factor (ECF subfamily) n=3 Tax=Bradyrhizobium elkanii TaxID=29448 RepID=A0ABV4FC20_BRAEL|nr:RNA polymerase sigma-70 factor (ECF subfamily) [Bradyrhizobium elkanii]MCP1978149.1 RNA polymerase sigma-70 factor (ECF subfamily) [Bradyrhizobium elkanii]MCS3588596.1 RNA polymerase sigma-70 factor (ECF subfamily) [Bradyrhizobium elkanii]MCS3618040.1 RNA polymerase sigma-70 factor (ECF subfamily) [Bradyrhizobium elkanii]MCS3685998.1 RNA polymerase sigma-70 factor (ECF subfamily) [Bradyrhizobium elkanii]
MRTSFLSLRLARRSTTPARSLIPLRRLPVKLFTRCNPMMRSAKAGNKTAQQFRDAALPCLDDAYAFAQVLMRTEADAELAVQECYRRALRRFDGLRGPAIRPWLLAILKAVCLEKLGQELAGENVAPERRDSATIRQLVADLPAPLREVIALREMIDLSYKEIAEVTGIPVTTVMSRIAEARAMLLAARRAANKTTQTLPEPRLAGGASKPAVYRAKAC